MEWLTAPEAWAALVTLTVLEIVLGIDNIIFISILVSRLPPAQQNSARTLGLALAMATRIMLLLSITWVMRLEKPLFTIFTEAISGRDLVLLAGGLFLLAKATIEIHHAVEDDPAQSSLPKLASFGATIVQIAILDIVFSLDSVITAVGMANHLEVMVIAIVIAVLVMMVAARPIGEFVEAHPTIKMLALSFLVLIGVVLIGEAFDFHIPKGYIYFALSFSVSVELLNVRVRQRHDAAARRKNLTEKQ